MRQLLESQIFLQHRADTQWRRPRRRYQRGSQNHKTWTQQQKTFRQRRPDSYCRLHTCLQRNPSRMRLQPTRLCLAHTVHTSRSQLTRTCRKRKSRIWATPRLRTNPPNTPCKQCRQFLRNARPDKLRKTFDLRWESCQRCRTYRLTRSFRLCTD